MNSLLSAISGQFAKAIALGTMFPVIILAVLNIIFVAPLLAQTAFLASKLQLIAVGDEKWGAVAFLFIILVITALLYNLNIPIIRLYEGYPWMDSIVGQWVRGFERRRFVRIQTLHSSAASLWEELAATAPDDPAIDLLQSERNGLALILSTELPDDENYLLPTRLGNVIRCFERYSTQAYGMDAIVLWPRLVAKIDPTFASTIDESKTSFDFMLNTSFLCALTAAGLIAISLCHPLVLAWRGPHPFFWKTVVFIGLAFLFYSFAVSRAAAWGDQVRSAFDLYRLDLLSKLGYAQKPLTYQEERAIWLDISGQLLYASSRNDPLPYDQKTMRFVQWPWDIEVTVSREIGKQQANLHIPVSIGVTNWDRKRDLSVLRIIDTIPDGFKYVPDSISVDQALHIRPPGVSRFAPLEFQLGPIPRSKTNPPLTHTITYEISPASTGGSTS